MRKSILAIAAIAAAISAPIAAQAQSDQSEMTTGLSRGGSVVVDGIETEQLPAFREYVIRERIPDYSVPERVVVGTVLPDTGVTFYDVPQTYGVTTYRYTVVNGRTRAASSRSSNSPAVEELSVRPAAAATGHEGPVRFPPTGRGSFLPSTNDPGNGISLRSPRNRQPHAWRCGFHSEA
jgi:hypothetical protein